MTETKKFEGYLCLRKNYAQTYKLKARVVENSPKLEAGEIAIKLNVELPELLFKRPQLEANILIPESDVPKSIINTVIQDNVEKCIQEVTGAKIVFTVVPATQK